MRNAPRNAPLRGPLYLCGVAPRIAQFQREGCHGVLQLTRNGARAAQVLRHLQAVAVEFERDFPGL
jgi:hypothetical protein